MAARILYSTALLVLSTCLLAVAANSKTYEGKWKSGFNYEGASYDMELLLEMSAGDSLSGRLRVSEYGNQVDAVGLKTVETSGDSLVIQTSSIDGRGARFVLKSSDGNLAGKMWETYSEKIQGASWDVVFEKLKE